METIQVALKGISWRRLLLLLKLTIWVAIAMITILSAADWLW